ncbi:hypothetical protein D2N39_02540 [Gemmobacter lutimaris]|uniref:Lipoprotein n=1 Tax=Gemmobacter lutimaris TaxID=2306023 RepID=A0A398C104_9RHOB|nr:hypothetical protein [Gemmobacter lutimaris]RID93950.1 hypothetical protein D2N39_02540 [Gemmobacter lutimaris]
MSSTVRIVFALCTVAFVAACAGKQEEVVYVDEPQLTTEPVYTGKYK